MGVVANLSHRRVSVRVVVAERAARSTQDAGMITAGYRTGSREHRLPTSG